MRVPGDGRRLLFYGIFVLAGTLLSCGLWRLADLAKCKLLSGVLDGVRPWAQVYYHPYEGALLNYLFLVLVLAVLGLALYILLPRDYPAKAVLPGAETGRRHLIAAAAAIFLLAAVSWEPMRLVLGPVPLMNEYQEMYSTTLFGGKEIRNGEFLSPKHGTRSAVLLRHVTQANRMEYLHQVMGRGQINHIGHILNPINEYELGKPLKDIYMQYGLGDTMLLRWTMRLFGGVSIDNYYKCYVFYPLYFALLLGLLLYLFSDAVYVLCAFSAAAFTYFSYNYIGLVLAPGIMPTVHFFDVITLFSLAFFLGRGGLAPLLFSALSIFCAIFINRQFGAMLALAWASVLGVYGFENRRGVVRLLYLAFPLGVVGTSFLVAGGGGGAGSEGMLASYFSGFFSWKPKAVFVAFTVAYLLLSYLFLLLARGARTREKYLYLFTFVYTQGLFIYFYWSGLVNHFYIVLPFMTMQLLFAAIMVERGEISSLEVSPDFARFLKGLGCLGAAYLVSASARSFYFSDMGERAFRKNFSAHRTYNWTFEKARLVSTIDPSGLREATGMLRRYSAVNGVALISKYDNLLPFLAGRYNLLPHFEMPWYLISEKRYSQALKTLHELAPEYLFADSDLVAAPTDPWSIIYNEPLVLAERPARAGRLAELRKLFSAVRADYRLVEKGQLISVYRRIPGR